MNQAFTITNWLFLFHSKNLEYLLSLLIIYCGSRGEIVAHKEMTILRVLIPLILGIIILVYDGFCFRFCIKYIFVILIVVFCDGRAWNNYDKGLNGYFFVFQLYSEDTRMNLLVIDWPDQRLR